MKPLTITAAMSDPHLFGRWFGGPSWDAWCSALKAAYCLPLSRAELATFRQLAGGRDAPPARVRELWVIAGRRAGKDSVASLVASHAAALTDWHQCLRPGERAVCQCLAADRQQAAIVLRYIKGYFNNNDLLRSIVERETQDGLDLTTGATIEVTTSDYRSVRGRTVAVAIMDEVAFWNSERTIDVDLETFAAIQPSLATLPNSLIIGISTPYKRAGLLWNKHREHYGKNTPDVLVIQAPSTALNPTLDAAIITRALEADPIAAAAEWLGQFRSDIEGFVTREVIDACTVPGRHELPPRRGIDYRAFVDPSGGSSDSMSLAVGHAEQRDGATVGVLDCIREVRPPFSPESVVREFATLLRSYNINRVVGDRYGGSWPSERFHVHGIVYEASELVKSSIYTEMLPLLNSGALELLDHPRLQQQLLSLERRTGRGTGKDSIDHPPSAHDDLANAAAGVLVAVAGKSDPLSVWRSLADGLGANLYNTYGLGRL